MSENIAGILLSTLGLILIAILGQLGAVLVKRFRGRASEPELYERVDKLHADVYGTPDKVGLLERVAQGERKQGAYLRIIRDLVRQWRGPVPFLSPADLAEVDEDTIPVDHPIRKPPKERTQHV